MCYSQNQVNYTCVQISDVGGFRSKYSANFVFYIIGRISINKQDVALPTLTVNNIVSLTPQNFNSRQRVQMH